MNEITWQDPPPSGRTGKRRGCSSDFADALRAQPGKWALYNDDVAQSLAAAIKSGKMGSFAPAGAFEAVTRRRDEHRRGRGSIWVRYVGTETPR